MKKQNGPFARTSGSPIIDRLKVPGTHFFTKLRNPRTTFRDSGFRRGHSSRFLVLPVACYS